VRSGSDRRALLGITLLAAAVAWPSAAGAHPSHLVEPIVVDDLGYTPADVTILEGRTVQWRWENAIPHSVTSAPGTPEAFDSGTHSEGDDSFVRRFDVPGTYAYSSGTSSPRIEGIIRVEPLPTDPPAIEDLTIKDKGDRPIVRFRINEKLDVVVRFQEERKGEWRTEQSISQRLGRGMNDVRARKKLKRGAYRAKVTAYDRYGREDTAKERFRQR
jgi:plastocyanin